MAGPAWTCTRSQIIDALANIEVWGVKVTGPTAGKVIADDLADAILSQLPQVRAGSTEHAVARGGEDPDRDARVEFCDDAEDAAGQVAWFKGGYVIRREVFRGPWERVPQDALRGAETHRGAIGDAGSVSSGPGEPAGALSDAGTAERET
jgi:hypothetical protein